MPEAPVCHLEPLVDIDGPSQPRMPVIPPIRGDIDSMVKALNALKMGYEILANQRGGPDEPVGSSGFKKGNSKVGRFNEVKRQTKKVRVSNPDDPSQYVDVDRINKLTMRDTKTGELWTWEL